MTSVLKGLCFAGLGAILACMLTLVVTLSYSYQAPSRDLVVGAGAIGSLLGLVAGAIWGSTAIKWLLEGLMNL